MSVTISRLNVILSGNMSGLVSLMNGAEAKVKSFEASISSAGGRIGGILAGIGVGVSLAGVEEFVRGQMEAIDSTAKLADRMGITTQAFAGLEHAAALAGVSSEGLTGALEKMLRSIAKASEDGGKAAQAFQAIGLSADRLVNLSPDEAFKQIAAGLAAVNNPALRAADAMDIFGKSGQSLLPLLMSGASGISAMQEEAERLGYTFSRVDAAKVEAANDAMTRLVHVIQGMGRAIAIEAAPYVQGLTDKLVELGTRGGGGARMAASGVHALVAELAAAADLVSLVRGTWFGFAAAFGDLFYAMLYPLDLVIQGVDWLAQKLGDTPSKFAAYLDGFTTGVAENIERARAEYKKAFAIFDSGANSKGAAAFFATVKANADQAASAVRGAGGAFASFVDETKAAGDGLKHMADGVEALRKELATFGKTNAQRKLFDVTDDRDKIQRQLEESSRGYFKMTGGAALPAGDDKAAQAKLAEVKKLQDELAAANEKVAEAEKLAGRLDGWEAQKKAQDELAQKAKQANDEMRRSAQRMYEETRTPMEKYEEKVREIDELLRRKLIDPETADREKKKTEEEFIKKNGEDWVRAGGPKLLTAGSQEAEKFAGDIQRRAYGENLAREALAQHKQQTALLASIRAALQPAPAADGPISLFSV